MSTSLAVLLCLIGVVVLLYLDRDKSTRNSKAIWLPIIWIGLAGSRPVSSWFGFTTPSNVASTLDGSPFDAAILGALLAMGVIALLGRKKKAGAYLVLVTPIVIYFIYGLISVTWAPYAVPALKRWTKDLGDLVMVLIIVTDIEPISAIRRVFSTVGSFLFPFSIVLIRYSTLGRAWDADGYLSIVGVTNNKNMLGLIVWVISLGVLWNLRSTFTNRRASNRGRRLAAQGTLFILGLVLLVVAHSSTSIGCFLLGAGLMFATHLRSVRSRPSRVHVLCLGILILGGLIELFGAEGAVASALGRQPNLSGRTEMWAAMLPAVTNPMIGVGFDSFWTSPNAQIFHYNLSLLHWYHPENINEAHNGYIEVYLDLGWIGVCLMSLILISGYWRACKAFRRNPELGSLILAYIMCGSIYSITEAGFRTLNPVWICLLLAIVTANGVDAGLFDKATRKTRAPRSAGAHRHAAREHIEEEVS